jgi:hypothetical protein
LARKQQVVHISQEGRVFCILWLEWLPFVCYCLDKIMRYSCFISLHHSCTMILWLVLCDFCPTEHHGLPANATPNNTKTYTCQTTFQVSGTVFLFLITKNSTYLLNYLCVCFFYCHIFSWVFWHTALYVIYFSYILSISVIIPNSSRTKKHQTLST